ncbi:MAG: c-type cytochrome [Luteimonas sp.]
MAMVTRGKLLFLTVVATVAVVSAAAFAWSGLYDIGADDAHTRPVAMALQAVREQSIDHHAAHIQVPALDDAAMVRRGAGNFEAMCSQCHTPPGEEQGELSRGLYPAPADLTHAVGNPAHQFWVIKHGIKASGMPAWGKSMDDASIWGMVAFLQRLPGMDAGQYDALVGSSGGHSHGGADPHGDHMPGDHMPAGHMPGDHMPAGMDGMHSAGMHTDGGHAAAMAPAGGPMHHDREPASPAPGGPKPR